MLLTFSEGGTSSFHGGHERRQIADPLCGGPRLLPLFDLKNLLGGGVSLPGLVAGTTGTLLRLSNPHFLGYLVVTL